MSKVINVKAGMRNGKMVKAHTRIVNGAARKSVKGKEYTAKDEKRDEKSQSSLDALRKKHEGLLADEDSTNTQMSQHPKGSMHHNDYKKDMKQINGELRKVSSQIKKAGGNKIRR